MQNPLKQLYSEEYYQQRSYEFDYRYPFFATIARALVETFKPKKVLDVGCAKGYLVYALREMGVEAWGVDISEYAISHGPENVKEFLSNVDVDFEELPFQPETFDLVTALECVEHLQNSNHFISEVKRVLQPNGIVFIMTPKKHWDKLQQLVTGPNPSHVNLQSRLFWIQAFKSLGFVHIGDLPRWVQKHARAAWKNASKQAIADWRPGKIGKYLFRFCRAGKWLRDELASAMILLPSDALFFSLQERGKPEWAMSEKKANQAGSGSSTSTKNSD